MKKDVFLHKNTNMGLFELLSIAVVVIFILLFIIRRITILSSSNKSNNNNNENKIVVNIYKEQETDPKVK